jgi:putative ABC transport system substrate-binding protein
MSVRRREFIAGLGGTAVWPLAARAQQRPVPVVGYLTSGREGSSLVPSFHQGLGEQGYVVGRNVEVLERWADHQNDRLPALAADLARRRVAVIFASADTGLVAKSATATIPIVFTSSTDPVELGLVASLNRPGGTLTGVYFLIQTLTAKRLELLHEIVPGVKSIGLLVNPTSTVVETQIGEAEAAARALRVRLVSAKASTPSEIEKAFAILGGQQIGALLVAGDALFFGQATPVLPLPSHYGK